MPDLCTVLEVKRAHPVIEHNDDDGLLAQLVSAASEAVIHYLDKRAATVIGLQVGGALSGEVPNAVRVATIITARHLYEGEKEVQGRAGGLPYHAEMLLYRLADPPVA